MIGESGAVAVKLTAQVSEKKQKKNGLRDKKVKSPKIKKRKEDRL